jgi:hypothetical protein
MVSYAVPPERVRKYIPEGLELDTRLNSMGEERAFVSVVIFLNDHIRLFPTKWPTMTFLQVNYRTYVHHKGVPGVWFFKLMQASKMASFNRRVFGAPTFYADLAQEFDLDRDGGAYRRYQFNSLSPDHTLHLDVEPAPGPPELDGLFSSGVEMNVFLSSRPDGYFADQRKPGVTSLTIWHETLQPTYGEARKAEFGLFSDLGLVRPEEQAKPYSVLLTPLTTLLGQMPKKFVP